MGGEELSCGSVKFQKIVASTPAQKKQVEDVIAKEISVIDDLVKLVTMGEKIQVLKDILAQDPDDAIRNTVFNSIFPYLKAGRIKNDGNYDKEIDKIVDKIMAKVLADKGVVKYNLTADRIAKIRESLAFALKRPEIKQILTFIPTKKNSIPENLLVDWSNNIAEYAAYLKDGCDLWDKTVVEYNAVKKTLSEDVAKKFADAPKGKKRSETLKVLIDQDIPGIEQELDTQLRPVTRDRINAVKTVECNAEGKECKDVTDPKLRSSALVCVRNTLQAILDMSPSVDFTLNEGTKKKIADDSNSAVATATAEPDSWSYTYDNWLRRNPGMPRLTLNGNFGISSTPGDLDTKTIGVVDGPITINGGVRIAADWDRFHTSNYQFRFGPYYSYDAKYSPVEKTTDNAETPSASKHQYGAYVMGRNITPSYFPEFSLRLNGLSYKTSIPMYPNPNETSFNVKANAGELIYNFGNTQLGLDTGGSYGVGNVNDLGWMRGAFNAGPRLSFATPFPMSFTAGYQRVMSRMETRFNPFSPDAKFQYNAGHGFYGSAMFDLLPYGVGSFWLYGDMTVMDKFHNEGSLAVDYRSPRISSWANLIAGLDYRAENLNNGLSHRAVGRFGVEGIPFIKGLATFGIDLYGGYQNLDYDANSGMPPQKGGVVGLNLNVTLGAADKPNKHDSDYYRGYEGDLATVAPSPAKGDLKIAIAKTIATDKDSIFADPMARMLFGGSEVAFDASRVAAYVIQFKAGKLNAEYTLGAVPSNINDAAKEVDGNIYTPSAGTGNGQYGYKLPVATEVGSGDVAPIAVYVGGKDVLAFKNEEELKSDYLPNIYKMSPDKLRIVKIGVGRNQMIAQGVPVKASNQGTQIAKDLLDSLSVMTSLVDDIDPKWASIAAYSSIKDKDQFKKQYDAEIKAQVIGPAVMAMAKYVLACAMAAIKGKELDEVEIKSINGMAKLTRSLVDVIMAYSYNKIKTASQPEQPMPSLEVLKANIANAPKPEAPKAPDKPAVLPPIAVPPPPLPPTDKKDTGDSANPKPAFDAKKYAKDKCSDPKLKLASADETKCETGCGGKATQAEADACVADYAPLK